MTLSPIKFKKILKLEIPKSGNAWISKVYIYITFLKYDLEMLF